MILANIDNQIKSSTQSKYYANVIAVSSFKPSTANKTQIANLNLNDTFEFLFITINKNISVSNYPLDNWKSGDCFILPKGSTITDYSNIGDGSKVQLNFKFDSTNAILSTQGYGGVTYTNIDIGVIAFK